MSASAAVGKARRMMSWIAGMSASVSARVVQVVIRSFDPGSARVDKHELGVTVGPQAEEALVVVDWYGSSYLAGGGAAGVQLAVQGVGDDGDVVIPLDARPVLGHGRDADEGRGAQLVADVFRRREPSEVADAVLRRYRWSPSASRIVLRTDDETLSSTLYNWRL